MTLSSSFLLAKRDAALKAMRWHPSGSQEFYEASVNFMVADGMLRALEADSTTATAAAVASEKDPA